MLKSLNDVDNSVDNDNKKDEKDDSKSQQVTIWRFVELVVMIISKCTLWFHHHFAFFPLRFYRILASPSLWFLYRILWLSLLCILKTKKWKEEKKKIDYWKEK